MVAIFAGGWFEHYAKGPRAAFAPDGFTAWIAAPFALLLIAAALAHSLRAQAAVLAVSAAAAIAGIYCYWDAMFLHVDAQGALVFVFTPLYQLAAGTLTLAGVIYARARAKGRRRHDEEKNDRQ
jgi:hypothetical protein